MRLKLFVAAGLLAGTAMTSTVAAIAAKPSSRPETGTLIPGRETSAPVDSVGYKEFRSAPADRTKVALTSASSFAECIVRKRPDQARTVVLESIHDVRKRFPQLLDPNCLPDKKGFDVISKMSFPGDTFHQMLSNALVRTEFAATAPTDFSSVPVISRDAPKPISPEKLASMPEKLRERAVAQDASRQTWFLLSQIGECVSRRSPDGVRALALTPVASSEELAAARKLQPDVAACVPAGTTVRMRASDLRGPAVRSYYHLARCALTGTDNPIRVNGDI